MNKAMKIKAFVEGNAVVVKMLIYHPMETGLRKDKSTGTTIAAHYVREVVCEHNGRQVLTANYGSGIAENPYLSFRLLDGQAGDTVRVSWVDNREQAGSGEVRIEA